MREMTVEVTDTFGGEANYSWVRRDVVQIPGDASDLAIVRKAKSIAGYTNIRCQVTNYGDEIVIDPSKECVRIFVTFA